MLGTTFDINQSIDQWMSGDSVETDIQLEGSA